MRPYIESINRNNTIGDLVLEYGEIRWRNGFVLGFFCGTIFSMSIILTTNILKK
jgi:hypothetical protein